MLHFKKLWDLLEKIDYYGTNIAKNPIDWGPVLPFTRASDMFRLTSWLIQKLTFSAQSHSILHVTNQLLTQVLGISWKNIHNDIHG